MSIVVGLGITRILSSIANLIEGRESVRIDFLSIMWAVNVLQYLVIYWWVVVGNWRAFTTWSFPGFIALFLYGVFLYFCAALVLPGRVDPGLDLGRRFDSIRRPFFAMWLLVLVAEVVDSFLKGVDYVLHSLGPFWMVVNGFVAALILLARTLSSRKAQRVVAVLVFLVYAGWTLSMFRSL
jgi:hypothetical protein